MHIQSWMWTRKYDDTVAEKLKAIDGVLQVRVIR